MFAILMIESPKKPRTLLFFYLIVVYVILQFGWWAYMLIDLNTEVYQHKLEMAVRDYAGTAEYDIQKGQLDKKLTLKLWMVLGEGSVFFVLLIFGILKTRNSFKKEVLLANQQKNFLLSVTHELKSPIASVKLYLQTMLKRKLDEEKKDEIVLKAISETDRLHSLVENLLLATKIDKSDYNLHFEEVNLSEHLDKVLDKLTANTGSQIEVKKKISPEIKVLADILALDSIIHNLFENAVKYSGGHPTLTVELKKEENLAVLKFSDTGPGIGSSEKAKVFEKFYRVGNEDTRKTKGTGLGLYIVKRLIERHRGAISLGDNQPNGAVFEIRLKVI